MTTEVRVARTNLKTEYWADTYNDSDIDDVDEFPGGGKINGHRAMVHAPDVEVEEYNDDESDYNFGTQIHQYNIHSPDDDGSVNDESYMVDQDGDGNILTGFLDEMRRWR